MPLEKYTLNEYATMMREKKPYLIALEELVEETKFGEVELTLQVRSGVVERMPSGGSLGIGGETPCHTQVSWIDGPGQDAGDRNLPSGSCIGEP
mgnify:CR=1 FL=1